ncbi:hypothetical protein AA0120_g10047 [Alternaria tenuissima]|nr:hypothetical protein AA0120_g10047 [Alternaria tenuissima]
MAIHNDYPGLTVQIICGGKPIEEHVYEEEEEEEESKTTTRYIESQSNAEFAIEATFRPPFTPLDLTMHVHLDGVKVDGLIARKHRMLNRTYVQSKTEWKEGQEWRASKFVLSDLIVVQEESETLARENLGTLSHVGTISVVLIPILSTQMISKPKGKKRELREVGPIFEEAFKGDARSHVTGFETHIAAAALKSLGIVSRSPSPSQDTQPESITKGNTIKSSPDCSPRNTSSIVTPQAGTASTTRGLLQQSPTPINQRMQSSLTKKDILVLINHYRGSSDDLEGLPEKDLAILLSSYRVSAQRGRFALMLIRPRGDRPDDTPTKQEPVLSESSVRIKREPFGDSVVSGSGKKRKMDVIVLDD